MTKHATADFADLAQPATGYRYGIDSFLLARFARFYPEDSLCDLGAGVGILCLIALTRSGVHRAVAVEAQEALAEHISENADRFGVSGRLEVLHSNWKQVRSHLKPKSFEVVMSNPPYRKAGTGKISPETSKAIAKHEILGSMKDLVEAAVYLLKNSGRLYLMYPPLRLEELFATLQKFGLKVQRMALVHPYPDRPATLVMVEAVKSMTRELCIEPPVIVYQDENHYTPEIEAWVGLKRRV